MHAGMKPVYLWFDVPGCYKGTARQTSNHHTNIEFLAALFVQFNRQKNNRQQKRLQSIMRLHNKSSEIPFP